METIKIFTFTYFFDILKTNTIMNIELYELLTDRYMLYKELEKGINSLEKGEKYSEKEVYDELDKI